MFFSRFLAVTVMVLSSFIPAAKAAPDAFRLLETGGKGGWLNVTRPLTAADIKGRLVLLDFWTYGCINCMQIVPELEALEQEFGDQLLILGVHSAKFDGEKDNARILAAAKRFGLKHPVINDSDYAIWNEFQVKAWPTLILLGPEGREIARYAGEGHGPQLAKDIRLSRDKTSRTDSLSALIAADENTKILSFPARLAYNAADNMLYVTDSGHHRIIGVDKAGRLEMTAGSGQRGFADGSFADAQFDSPRGLAVDGNILYVADTGNHRIRRIDLGQKTVTTLAGTGQRGFERDFQNSPALTTALASPWDVEMTDDGKTLAIANAGTHQILGYDMASGTLSLLAGSGREDIKDGPAAVAALAQPSGLSSSGAALFFADAESSALRVLENGTVKTLIGTGLFDFGLRDGKYPDAMLQHPQGLYADAHRVILADTYNNALRVYDRDNGILSTMTLTGPPLNEPGDVLVTEDIAYIADTGAHAIRTLDLKTGETGSLLVQTP